MSTKKQEKQLTMRQQLREKAEEDLANILLGTLRCLDEIAEKEGIDRQDLVKAVSMGSHKTAEHALVTQLANRYEADVLRMWNDQQALFGEEDGND